MIKTIGNLTLTIDDKAQTCKADTFVLELFLRDGELEESIAVDLPDAAITLLFPVVQELERRARSGSLMDYIDLEGILDDLALTAILEDEYFTDWERKEYQVYRSHQWWWYDQQGHAHLVEEIAQQG